MHDEIVEKLTEVERDSDVRIIYACESGSRSWGFASSDSEYDVRFIYVRRPQEYLRLDEPRDVIELPIENDLDINGWDLKKALRQLRKSNPVLMEWLDSPIVYQQTLSIADRIRGITPSIFRPSTAFHHYMSMAKSAFRTSHKGEEVALKKYFYALRPLFAVMWIEQGHGPVPMEFRKLMERLDLDDDLRSEIDILIRKKSIGAELGLGPRIEPISDFLETEIARREHSAPTFDQADRKTRDLDRLFLDSLAETWQSSEPRM